MTVPPGLREPDVLGNLTPTPAPDGLPAVASLPEDTAWLNEHALLPFIDEVRAERLAEVEHIAEHVELSLTEVLQRVDEEIGRAAEEVENDVTGAEGRLAQAETPTCRGDGAPRAPTRGTQAAAGGNAAGRGAAGQRARSAPP